MGGFNLDQVREKSKKVKSKHSLFCRIFLKHRNFELAPKSGAKSANLEGKVKFSI